ncbi:MAG TPA: hypothetical protein VJM32_04515 [Candidatus Saccharimonadales bacterium]|nr:hypothetical protein [Candidatus Saccharimonadales bacterium]
MRKGTKLLLAAVVVGGATTSAVALLRKLRRTTVVRRLSLDTDDPQAAVAQLTKLLSGIVPGFPSIDGPKALSAELDEPRTIGEVREEAEFIENLRVAEWPFTDDTVLDITEDDKLTVEIVVHIGDESGAATLVEAKNGFVVTSYTNPEGVVHDTLPEAFAAEELLDYPTFIKLMEEHNLNTPATAQG